MNKPILNTFNRLLLIYGALFIDNAAALSGTETATVDFQGMANATYGKANENGGTFIGDCTRGNCFVQNGIVVGGVDDPTDINAHYHRQGTNDDREAQYHPDSTGLYVRMTDRSKFSLQSIYLNVTNGAIGGNFKLYGYNDAINTGMLTQAGETQGGAGSSSDPEGSHTPYIASYTIPNDGAFNGTITLDELKIADSHWASVGGFWLTFEGFNHSPTTNYAEGSYPDWDIRIDDIKLGDCKRTLQVVIR